MLLVLWVIYPIVWLIGTTGTGTLSPATEAFIYTVVDLLAKVGFGIVVTLGVTSVYSRATTPRRAPDADPRLQTP